MVRRLTLYLFQQLLIALTFATACVVFVVLFTQSFRLLTLVIDSSATSIVFFQLMGLTIPTLLPIVLPLGLSAAVLFVYHKLIIDSELVVMRASGLSTFQLAKPVIFLSLLVAVMCFLLTLWLAPLANRDLVTLEYQVKDSYSVLLARPGNFNDLSEGLTFYTRRRSSNGALEGIMIHDVRQPQTPITIMTDTGQIMNNNNQPQIVVFNGRRQQMDTQTGHLDELAFDQYVLDLNALRSENPPRLLDPREQSIFDLLNPTADMLRLRANTDMLHAELHQRFASPFLALSFTLAGLAIILIGEFNRRGLNQRLMVAGVGIIIIEALFMSLNSLVARHSWLTPILYMITLTPACIGFIALFREEKIQSYLKEKSKSS